MGIKCCLIEEICRKRWRFHKMRDKFKNRWLVNQQAKALGVLRSSAPSLTHSIWKRYFSWFMGRVSRELRSQCCCSYSTRRLLLEGSSPFISDLASSQMKSRFPGSLVAKTQLSTSDTSTKSTVFLTTRSSHITSLFCHSRKALRSDVLPSQMICLIGIPFSRMFFVICSTVPMELVNSLGKKSPDTAGERSMREFKFWGSS